MVYGARLGSDTGAVYICINKWNLVAATVEDHISF